MTTMTMEQQIVKFIAHLRASGVRVSTAESADALRVVEQIDIFDKSFFRSALQTTLIKEARDKQTFEQLFPFYFGGNEPPPMQQPSGGSMNPEEQRMLQQMLQQMLENMSPEELARLFKAMMSGQQVSQQQMRHMLRANVPLPRPNPRQPLSPEAQRWLARQAMRDMRFQHLEQALSHLLEQLREAGMREETLRDIQRMARENKQALADQVQQQVQHMMLEQMQDTPTPTDPMQSIQDRPFEELTHTEMDELRKVVMRMAARLRSRIALRLRRSKAGQLDAKHTIRTNLRFGGVPLVVQHRRRHLKPKITIICDLSYSMRPVTTFTLLLIYALQDQISRTRTFAFINDLNDITTYFADYPPTQALEHIQAHIIPPYSYATDLGNSLNTFLHDHLDCIDHRTTFIVLGDGRNNYNNPNLKAFDSICRRAHKVIWFNPEAPHMWGVEYPDTLNSDMLDYARMCDATHHVSTLRQLVAAIDSLFTRD